MTDATPVQVARTDGAEDSPLLPRSLLKQRWGDHFRAVRQAKGISQERLAARAGIAMTALANWEQGRNLPKEDSLQAVKALLPQLKTPEEIEAQLVAELANPPQPPPGELTHQRLLETTSARVAQLEAEVERLRSENESLRAELNHLRTPAPSEGSEHPSQGPCEGSLGDGSNPSQGIAVEPVREAAEPAVVASQGPQRGVLLLWNNLRRRLRPAAGTLTTLAVFFALSLMFSSFSSGAGGGLCSGDEGSGQPACPENEYWDAEFKKCMTKKAPPLRDCRVTGGEKPCCIAGEERCGEP